MRVLVASLALALSGSATIAAGPTLAPPEGPLFHIRIQDARAREAVRASVAGAFERLGSESCRRVLGDFANLEHQRLDAVLATQQQTPQGFLNLVLFYDGSQRLLCGDGRRLAFTTPFSRAVFVCSERFRQARGWNPERAEAVVIHEMLHSLGLGENPPGSDEITARVLDRCGRRSGSARRDSAPGAPETTGRE